MASDLDALATRFCKVLGHETGWQPMQWRSIIVMGARCRIRAPKELERSVGHAMKKGWLERRSDNSVALTDAGRKL